MTYESINNDYKLNENFVHIFVNRYIYVHFAYLRFIKCPRHR